MINSEILAIINKASSVDSLKITLTNFLKTSPQNKTAGTPDDDFITAQVNQLTSPWMSYFLTYNPAPVLENVNCPVLALNGEKDLQVPAEVNLTAIRKALEKGGNKHMTTKELPNLNHLFQECKTGAPAEYGTIEQTFSPVALEEIKSWILKQTK